MRLAPVADELSRSSLVARSARRAAARSRRWRRPRSPSDISLILSQEGGRRIALAVPPATAPASDVVQSELVDPFHKTLAGDLGTSPWFVLADPALHPKGFRPPATREEGDAWIASGAQFLLDTQIRSEGTNVVVSAQLLDLRTLRPILAKKYSAARRLDPAGGPRHRQRRRPAVHGQARALPDPDRLRLRPRRGPEQRALRHGLRRREPAPDHVPPVALHRPGLVLRRRQDRLPVVRQHPSRPLLVLPRGRGAQPDSR